MTKMQPVVGHVYTTKQIDNDLKLRDGAHLGFYNMQGEKDVVQDSHLAVNISTLPGWADLRWTYLRETHEWIPIFQIIAEDNDKLLMKLLRESDTEGPDEVAMYYPHMPEGFDAKGRQIKKSYTPKTYMLVDSDRHPDIADRGPFNLLSLIHTNTWSDEDFDCITDLQPGQSQTFENGRLNVTRVS